MFDGNVYYCWSCDAHCRAVENAATGATCPRCREALSADCRLDNGPQLFSFLPISEAAQKPAATSAKSSPGLWPVRTAAMH